jgi:hypothetical protein
MGEEKPFATLTGLLSRVSGSIYGRQTREDRQIQKAERRRQMKKPARGGGRP